MTPLILPPHSYLRKRGTASFTWGFILWVGDLGCAKLKVLITLERNESYGTDSTSASLGGTFVGNHR